jgi:hypothetical protein
VSDEQTVRTLRRAADAAVRDRHLQPRVGAAAWSDAQASRRRVGPPLAIAASVAAVVGVAIALGVWSTGDKATPSASGSACAGNVSTALLPTWARADFGPAGLHTPHVIGDRGEILGVLFGDLRVHQPAGTHNKILWVAKRGFGPLQIRAQLEGTSRTVARTLPDGPGPSYVDMPAPGCWQMSLTWAGFHDTAAFRYGP